MNTMFVLQLCVSLHNLEPINVFCLKFGVNIMSLDPNTLLNVLVNDGFKTETF
jgi:hypothetical protein